MSPILRRLALPAVLAVAVGALVTLAALGTRAGGRAASPSRQPSEAQREAIDEEREEAEARRFDAPDRALEFYVNKRTGPIVTRGPTPTTGVRSLNPAAYLPALQQMRAMPRFSAATGALLPSFDAAPELSVAPGAALGSWSSLGPSNQGGRTRALLVHPTTPNVMYAGGVGGGVWKSLDAGANWTALADLQMSNIAVASLAFDPANPNTIYAGTGEGFFNSDAVRGAGIFKSADAGATWTQLPATNTANFYYTASLVVSPRNSQRLFAATRTGIFRSTNGGASWTSVVAAAAVNGCTQLALQSSGPAGYVFAACGNFAQGTIYRAADDDASAFSVVLSLAGQGRSSIAVAPSNQAVVYVMASQATQGGGTGQNGLHGIYRSTSNGDPGSFATRMNGTTGALTVNHVLLSNPLFAFAQCVGASSAGFYNQGWYDNVLAVDPVDANRVWAGGVDLFRSDDGGANWGAAGYWWHGKGQADYHHADQHGIVFHPQYDGVTNKVMFATSDGGVDRTDDARAAVNTTITQICGGAVPGGTTWVDRNNGYTTTQFYDGVPYPDGQKYFGGLQDNGTQRGTLGSAAWAMLTGGDGGYVAVDTQNDGNAANDVLFAEFTGNSLQRSVNGGQSFADVYTPITGGGFLFIAPFAMNGGDRRQLWTGGYDIWRTTDQANTWARATPVGGTCGTGSISAIATHPLDGGRVLVGMSDGCYHYNHAALTAPDTVIWPGGTLAASAFISSLTWDPANLNVAYATIARFGGATLYKSVDGGVSWAPIMGAGATALPQIPALTVAVNPADSQQVFVGTDLGVFTSIDGGASWYLENTGFSNVSVEALKFNDTPPYKLFAFTHGRGAWQVALNSGGIVPPSAGTDSYTTAFNTPLTVPAPGVLGNDVDNGGGALTALLDTTVSAGAGTLVLNANGGFTFTPAASFTGVASFTYHATNSHGPSAVATVTVSVAAPPAPVAVNDNFNTAFNTPLTVAAPGVLSNDNASGGGAMTATLASTVSAAAGTLTLAASGGFTFTPAAGFAGPATFTYRPATVAGGSGNLATVTITVAAPPAPTASNDGFNTPFNTALVVAAPGVLGNDNANGGGAMTAAVATGPASGTLSPFGGDGSFTYTPANGFTGQVTFTYRASTVAGGTGNLATVTITVAAAVPTPVAVADGFTTAFQTPLSVSAPGLLANDNANGGGALSAVLDAGVAASAGTLSLQTSGAFTYSPAAGFVGQAAFTYHASNGNGPSNVAAVTITVAAPPPPTAVNDGYTTAFNTALTVAAPGLLANDNANGAGTMTAVSVSPPSSGTLSAVAPDGGFTYTPAPGFSGPATFSYRAVTTAGGQSAPATVTVAVTAPPAPTASNDSYATPFDVPLVVAAPGVLANDNANGGGALAAALLSAPASGTLSPFNANGGFTYSPAPGFSGAVTFTYRASTAAGGSSPLATVTVNVTGTPPPPPPTAAADSYATSFDTALTVAAPGVLGNDTPNGGGTMTAVVASSAANGSVALSADGAFTYTPNPGFSGGDSFTYRAHTLAGGDSAPAIVAITVAGGALGAQPPTNLRVTRAVGNTVTFGWNPPAVGPPATGYVIEGGLAPGEVVGALPLGPAPSFTITLPSGPFFFRVRTVAGGLTSAPSNELPTPVNLPVAPSPPDHLLALVAGDSLSLIWTNTFAGGAPTGVALDVSGAVAGSAPLGMVDTFSVAGVPPGTYTLSVRAYNASGASPPSTPVTVTIPAGCSGPPQPVTNFVAYSVGSTLVVAWDPGVSGPAPTGFVLNASGAVVASLPTTLQDLNAVVPPGSYDLSVVATNVCGASTPSPVQTVVVP